ncbi:hypothetical protein GLOTRDRAFT_48150 [Gloeophyllum trabeum ATCC 11539]|uniref:DUF6699 domain-containing protein n=1 Tax=Gloeophyllum trabeum (strain ATCC 11539 / FP-39264 / Madison 617) TaxID=670483 RepID=S7RBU7_GLOTA|nr:uncharacterized protein GLOTRDRAFT_48150 [Gloeophyllum trabeum ATCC 11539]EPQ51725.1 hypothetical protein GLOTRDRAFT_48150 [Gloeophyllum trabeum ATCC 11539]
MSDEFEKPATAPPVNKVVVVCDLGKVSSLWPPIEIERANPVTVWDIMHAIYEFFQKPMTQREVDYVSAIEPGNYEMLCEAFYKRIYDSSNIPEWERLRGIKRVDVLGDRRVWWGLWITYNPDDTWQLNLGLMPLRQSS